MSVLDKIDDTIPLSCIIIGTETVQSHTEFILRVQRGPEKSNSWNIRRRYNDFVTLHENLKVSGIDLPLPPKRLLGNMDREFIAERQHGLQLLLEAILNNPMLACSKITKKFLDTDNYNMNHTEAALQFVSMFLRSEPHWEVVEPMQDIGWRIKKSSFLIKPKDRPKDRMVLSWIEPAAECSTSTKDQFAFLKLLPNIQHPSIFPVNQAVANERGALVIRAFAKDGSMRDIICKSKPTKASFLKKYCNPKSYSQFTMSNIKQYGRQILEVLKFLHDKGLAFHHLHTGNIFIENEVCKLSDIENYMLSVPPYYKPFYSQFRKIHSSEAIDVYSFGHVFYEMVYCRPLNQPTVANLPPESPAEIRSVLECILSQEACKNGLPTLEGLLSHPLFADETVVTVGIKPQLKIPSKLKESFRQHKENLERKLKEEQKLISQVRRLSKAKAHHSSDSERRRRKLEARKKSSRKLEVAAECEDRPPSDPSSPSSPVKDADQGSSLAVPPPPPPPPTSPTVQNTQAPNTDGTMSRNVLLGSIQGFQKASLKKAVTVDKSAPKI